MKLVQMGYRTVHAVIGVSVLALGVSFSVFADEPAKQAPQSDKSVQERAVPMQRFGFSNVPLLQGPRTPIPPRGGTMNFSCNMTSCTCHGDADCNNMFSSNVCGRSAVCDTTSGVECSCLRSQ